MKLKASRTTWRLGLLLWLAGIPGVASVVLVLLPALMSATAAPAPAPAPLWAISVAAFLQSAILLTLAVWAGVALTPKLGLHAPSFEALAASKSVPAAFSPQLLPGLMGGALGAVLLVTLAQVAPTELAAAQTGMATPLLVRVLYGGITEELLLRWGLMSVLLWLIQHAFRHSPQAPVPAAPMAWIAIAISALLFGIGHLPAAIALTGALSVPITLHIVGGNALFGMLAGFLFWRHGLESAMLAHVLAHVFAFAVGS